MGEMKIPECPWRYGEKYLVTDFVVPNSLAISDTTILSKPTNDETFEHVAEWIRDSFKYPLDQKGNPSAAGSIKRYQKMFFLWEFSKYVSYMWGLVPEIMQTRKGICIDTANLCTSILIKLGIDAWTAIGEIRSATDNTLIGYHAWTEGRYKNEDYIIETTVEDTSNNKTSAREGYNSCSEWSEKNGIYYVKQARFNNSKYIGEGPYASVMPMLMGLPAKHVMLFGMAKTRLSSEAKPRSLEKEWMQETRYMNKLLARAYSRQ